MANNSVGVLFAAAPFVLGYDNNEPALWASLLIGAGVVVLSAFEAAEKDRDPMEYWLAAILGVGAIAALFLLNYDSNASAMWTCFGRKFNWHCSFKPNILQADCTHRLAGIDKIYEASI